MFTYSPITWRGITWFRFTPLFGGSWRERFATDLTYNEERLAVYSYCGGGVRS